MYIKNTTTPNSNTIAGPTPKYSELCRVTAIWELGVGSVNRLGVERYFCFFLYLSKKSNVCLRISGCAHASTCVPPITGSQVTLRPFALA